MLPFFLRGKAIFIRKNDEVFIGKWLHWTERENRPEDANVLFCLEGFLNDEVAEGMNGSCRELSLGFPRSLSYAYEVTAVCMPSVSF